MANIQAVIFDLDGVIVHTDKFHYQAWQQLADALNIEFNEAVNHRMLGVSRMESLDILLEASPNKYPDTLKKQFAQQKNDIYKQLLNDHLSESNVSGDILDILKTLKHHKIPCAIGSSSKNARFILEKIGLLNAFDVIVDGTDIVKSKPHPEVFLIAASSLKIKPENTLVVEDALSGVLAAKAGGFPSYHVGHAYESLGKPGVKTLTHEAFKSYILEGETL